MRFASCNFSRYGCNFRGYRRIFRLLDKTAEPLARLLPWRRGSGILCQSRFRRAVKIVSFVRLARRAKVKLFLAQKREMVFSFNRQHDAGDKNQITHNEHIHSILRTNGALWILPNGKNQGSRIVPRGANHALG